MFIRIFDINYPNGRVQVQSSIAMDISVCKTIIQNVNFCVFDIRFDMAKLYNCMVLVEFDRI